jgi:hypothetical protein
MEPEYAIMLIKGILNTIIRLVPVALYMGSIMSNLLFDNKKANVLLFGFILIEGISYSYKMITNAVNNPQCSIVKSDINFLTLPAPIPTSVGFLVSFLISDMYSKENVNPSKLYILLLLFIVTIWSRVNVGCHSIIDSMMAGIIGIIMGFGYYSVVKDYYNGLDYENLKPENISDRDSKIFKLIDLS